MCTFGFLVLSIRCEGDLWEISGSLRANKVWRSPGSDFSTDCGVSHFLRSYVFVCQSLLLCLPSLWHLNTRAFHMEETRWGEGGGLFNTSGKERKMAVSSQKSGFFSPKKRRRPQYFSPKKVSRGGAAQGSRCLLGLATSNKQVWLLLQGKVFEL